MIIGKDCFVLVGHSDVLTKHFGRTRNDGGFNVSFV